MTGSGITNNTRPTNLDDIVGMDYNKKIIKYLVGGSILLKEPIPSFIIDGPGGTGKSTLANIISLYSNGEVYKYMGSEIKSPDDIYEIALQVKDGDVVFIEEAHTIGNAGPKSKICQSILYEWIEDFKLTGGVSLGITTAPKVSFVFATTDPGKLTQPLRTRCQRLNTSYYNIHEIKEIIRRAATKVGIDVSTDDSALTLLAQSSRGSPRIAIMHRLDLIRKVMSQDQLLWNLNTVKHFMKEVGINDWGLEPNDVKYCKILLEKTIEGNGKPVSKKTMEQSTGFSDNTIENVIESYLIQIGAIKIERGGRLLTDLGKSFITDCPDIHKLKYEIDLTLLNNDCLDLNSRKMGMKFLMPKYGLSYLSTQDREIFKSALLKCGYISKKRVGIVKLSQ
jgi:Holliday junction DNA helicase RuvB